jgi:hypothetical protein
MRSLILAAGLLVGLSGLVSTRAFSQDTRAADQFFTGMVSASSAEQLTVSRMLPQGKNESRTFRITPDTKFEGQLMPDSRVTVRFTTADDGDVASLVIVRAAPRGRGKK